MSMWTHITACLSVETGIIDTKSNLKKYVLSDLKKNAPKITGSEGNADVFVNVQSGHNFFTSYDCEHCKYQDTLRDVTDEDGTEYQECDAPDGHKCSGDYQTCVTISIQGDLRDRAETETREEFEKFLAYVKDKYYIRDYAVNIEWE